ncbi:hypothetical protein [Brevibacterium moorei]|uniref:hypothetical protein n=1 Tax=Brevibacterium moorei TaxID=2968457 RepID=UPI00211BA4E6|nr:hypothetical protein [Brevibacterium sp. 68QC2CO]MCQ9384451.1 hypothetical protein [Brevibacterium sp. 68QC2CO]
MGNDMENITYDGDQPQAETGSEVQTLGLDSALSRLKRAVESKTTNTVTYDVPDDVLEGVNLALEFNANISTAELETWQKRSRRKGSRQKEDVDSGKVAALALVEKSVAVYMGGKKLTDGDGDAVTLRSEEMMSLTGVTNAADGVRALLGDGLATSFSDALVQAAGYGSEVIAGNPMSSN